MAHTDDFDMARVCVFEHVCKCVRVCVSVCVCKFVRAGVRERERNLCKKLKSHYGFVRGLNLKIIIVDTHIRSDICFGSIQPSSKRVASLSDPIKSGNITIISLLTSRRRLLAP